MKTPPGITYKAIYKPNMERMVEALMIVYRYNPPKKETEQEEPKLVEAGKENRNVPRR